MNQHYDPTVFSMDSTWPGLIADLGFTCGDISIDLSTTSQAPNIQTNGEWIQVVGASSAGAFNVYLPAELCLTMIEAADNDIAIDKLDGDLAALILEHILSEKLVELESVLGCDLAISNIADVQIPVRDAVYGVDVFINGQTTKAGLSVSGQLGEWVEYVVSQNSNLEERQLDENMVVHLGPVVLPSTNAYLVRSGEAINCGVTPSDIIKGILMRSDGRYWPIFIEDTEIEIAGPLAGPIDVPVEKTEYVYVTFGIGGLALSANARARIETGSRFEVERLPNNAANVYYQTRPFAQGNLSVIGENLAVTLGQIGKFEV
jgi:hypothetical protein